MAMDSRPFQLSRISSSYALDRIESTNKQPNVNDPSATGAATIRASNLPPLSSTGLITTAEEDEFQSTSMDEDGDAQAMMNDDHDELPHESMEGAEHEEVQGQSSLSHYQTTAPATDMDPYATMASNQSHSSLYPSGLLGLTTLSGTGGDETTPPREDEPEPEPAADDSMQPEETTPNNDDDGGRTAQHLDEAMNQPTYHHSSTADASSHDFVDDPSVSGWVGSFREQNDDDDIQAMEQRQTDEQNEFAQFTEDSSLEPSTSTQGRKRHRNESGEEDQEETQPPDQDGSSQSEDEDQPTSYAQPTDENDEDDGLPNSDATPAIYSAASQQFLPPPPPAASSSVYAPATPISNKSVAILSSSSGPYGGSSYHYPSQIASSPMYAYSPHHPSAGFTSPHLGPTSPRIHSHYYSSSAIPFGSTSAGVSSPRQDTIASVTHRIEHMQRSGRLNSLLNTAARFNQEVSGYATNSQPIPDYNQLTSPIGAARSSSKQALISIDQHLLRRYIFHVLDSDMIIRGVVQNKNQNMGLIINIAEILWPMDKPREVLTKQQQAAQLMLSQLQPQQDGMDKSSYKYPSASSHFFPPLSSFLGGIQLPNSQSSNSTQPTPSEFDTTYATEKALFSNFEVLSIHGECHLAEMHAPTPVKTTDPNAPTIILPQSASLERFSLGDQVKALVISVDIHSEKVYLSMNQNRLRGPAAAAHKLGVLPKETTQIPSEPTPYSLTPATSAPVVSITPSGVVPVAPPASGTGAFASMLSKLTPQLQDKISSKITSFGGTISTTSPNAASTVSINNSTSQPTPPSPTSGPMNSAQAAFSGGLGTSWAYNPYLKGGSTTPTHPSSSALPSHLLKSRPPITSKPLTPPTLSLLANPLLLAKAKNYLQYLHEQPLFKNPEGINKLTNCYHINQYGSLTKKVNIDPSNTYKNLRYAQNQAWAKESVVKGISLAKKGSFANAMLCYKHALDIEPKFIQAMVARGAAYVLQGQLKKAIKEFEEALKIDPQQPYALQYREAASKILNGKKSGAATAAATSSTVSTAAASSSTQSTSDLPTPSSSRHRDSSDGKKRHKKHRREESSKSSKHKKKRSFDATTTTTAQEVVNLVDSDSSSSDSDSPVKHRSKDSKKDRKKSSKKHRKKSKSKKKSKKDESRSRTRSRSDDSSDSSDRSRSSSTSDEVVAYDTIPANSTQAVPTKANLTKKTETSSVTEDVNVKSSLAVGVVDDSVVQSEDDWLMDRSLLNDTHSTSTTAYPPPPLPSRHIEPDSPTLSPTSEPSSIAQVDLDLLQPGQMNEMVVSPNSNALTTSHSGTAIATLAPFDGLSSPPMHLPMTFSSSSLSGLVLSPDANSMANFVHPFTNEIFDQTTTKDAPPINSNDEPQAKRIKLNS